MNHTPFVVPTPYTIVPHTQDIYVPDENSELVPWGLCLHNDSPSLAGRVDPSRLRCLHPRVSLEDCRRLRIPSVSQVIHVIYVMQGIYVHCTQCVPWSCLYVSAMRVVGRASVYVIYGIYVHPSAVRTVAV